MVKSTLWIQEGFEILDIFRPSMKYFQFNVNLLLYHHRLTPYNDFLESKTLKTLYLTSW